MRALPLRTMSAVTSTSMGMLVVFWLGRVWMLIVD